MWLLCGVRYIVKRYYQLVEERLDLDFSDLPRLEPDGEIEQHQEPENQNYK